MRFLFSVAIYVAAMAGLIYAPADEASERVAWVVTVAFILGHIVFGYAGRNSWLVLLPLAAIVIAVPAGYPTVEDGEPLPVWLSFAYFAPILMALIALGLWIRWLVERFRRRPSEAAHRLGLATLIPIWIAAVCMVTLISVLAVPLALPLLGVLVVAFACLTGCALPIVVSRGRARSS